MALLHPLFGRGQGEAFLFFGMHQTLLLNLFPLFGRGQGEAIIGMATNPVIRYPTSMRWQAGWTVRKPSSDV